SFTTLATTAIHPLSLHDALPIFRLQYVAHRRQSPVTRFEERFTLGERQLVRSYVLAALSHEHEWAIINDEELVEEPLGHPKTLRSEEHTSELQSRENLVCRLLLE